MEFVRNHHKLLGQISGILPGIDDASGQWAMTGSRTRTRIDQVADELISAIRLITGAAILGILCAIVAVCTDRARP